MGFNRIADGAFASCRLHAVSIPDSVTSIDDYAFKDCTALVSVTIPDSVTAVSKDVFSGCSSLSSDPIPANARVHPS